jgi:pimeloyl-ACP methyl ester carboxylesterase
MFQSWQAGFLDAYISYGTQKADGDRIRLSCDPVWESRVFSAYPYDLWRYIALVKQPVLILYGEKSDTFGALAVKRFKKKVPHAVIQPLPRTGHFVPMEKPGQTAAAIAAFVENNL